MNDFYVGKPDPALPPDQALPPDKRLPVLDQNTPEGFCAVEAACLNTCLDYLGVPRKRGEFVFSLWGRVCEYVKQEERKRSSNE